MTLLLVSTILSLVVLPLLALYWLPRRSPCRLLWGLKAAAVGSYVGTTVYLGGWHMLSYYGRYALLVLFVATAIYGGWRMRRRIFWARPEGWQWGGPLLAGLLLLLSGAGLWAVYQSHQIPDEPVSVTFPLRDGAFYVASGGSQSLMNPHMKVQAPELHEWRGQLWGLDVVELHPSGNRASGLYPTTLDRYAIFGTPVYAPCDGTVEATEETLPDLTPPARDTARKAGNYVLLRCAPDAYVLLAHLKHQSVQVEPGDSVSVSTRLGQIGNSGNSWEPHLHLSAQRSVGGTTILDAEPRPLTFDGRFPVRNDVMQERAAGPHSPEGTIGAQAQVEAVRRTVVDPGSDRSSPEERLRTTLDSLRTADGFPGATAAVVSSDGPFRAIATGLADREDSTKMTPDTRMLSGSTGKSFVAAVVLALVQDGRLELGAPIIRWLGDRPWFDRLPNGDTITLRMLLRHQSGLIDHIRSETFQRAVRKRMQTRGPDATFDPEELVRFVLGIEPLFPAGEGYHYSDTNYILAGLVVEAVTGRDYYDVLRDRLLDPLPLPLTDPANRRTLPNLAAGYIEEDDPFGLPPKVTTDGVLVYNPATEWTGGGLVTNSQDLARWAKGLYEGEALPGNYRDALLDAVPKDSTQQARYGPEVRYGLGVTIRSTALGTAYGHRGWTPGYRSIFEYYPGHELTVALQINASGPYSMTDYAVHVGRAALASPDL